MARGSWAAARLWAAADRRARWRSLIALGLIAGVTAGLALATLAGSVRTGSALDRLRDRTNASDAIVFASQAGVPHPDWSALGDRPEVRAVAPWALVFGELEGDPEGVLFAPTDDRWMQSVDAPVVVEGRMFDPRADDEMVVADAFAHSEGIEVGDAISFTPYTAADLDAEGLPAGRPLQGPELEIRIVGLIRTPLEQLFVPDGFTAVSPGILQRHPEIDYLENANVQLDDAVADMGRLEAHATQDIGPGTPLLDLHSAARRVTASTDVERAALTLLSIVIAIAGLVLAGQIVVRSASIIGRDARVLTAMGMTRRTIAWTAALSHLLAAATAGLVVVPTALVTSRWLPLGQAARVEPDTGLRFDPWIVVPGAASVALVLLAAAFLTAWVTAGPRRTGADARRGGVAEWLRRRTSAPVGVGVTLGLRRGSGPNGLPVRPALLGAAVGVLGVAGALTLDAGLRDALAHPERAGVVWDAQILPGTTEGFTAHGFVEPFASDVKAIDGVAEQAQVDRSVVQIESATGVPTYAVRPVQGDDTTEIALAILDGRAPEDPTEAALGPGTADALGIDIGDTLGVGTVTTETVTIVGTVLFPTDVHSQFDEGIWLHPTTFDRVTPEPEAFERYIVVRFASGAKESGVAALADLAASSGWVAAPVDLPPELTNLRGVLPLPRLLAAFLAVLALAALLHVLVSTTRVRAGDFAVLRALGFTRRSTRLVLYVQSAAVFTVGLLFGIPIGLAAGRVGWSLIAERVPLEVVTPLALVATALLVPTTLVVAQVVAVGPGRRAARLRPAEVLRAE